MTRISAMFKATQADGKTALIPFITAGDPTLESTATVLESLVRGGADLIEIGVPYSDPMADGPVIQRTSERALLQGVRISDILELVRRFREHHQTPIILFGYYNPFFQYGLEDLAKDAAAAGVDGFLVVDLPPEEAAPFQKALSDNSLDFIALVTPTSDDQRLASVRTVASGFVYYVSVKGVTGARQKQSYADLAPKVRALQESLALPIAVGFGISTPEQVGEVGQFADATVIGSALIQAMEPHLNEVQAMADAAETFIRTLKTGTGE